MVVKVWLGTLAAGAALGFSLSRIGFSSWDEVHGMFTFQSWRLLATFVIGVVVLGVCWRVVRALSAKPPNWPTREVHPGSVIGGALFGTGWALGGACPSIALVQLGEGQLDALLTLFGIFAGNWLYSVLHARFFRWSATSCADE